MVMVSKGILITTDKAMREFLLSEDRKRSPDLKFVLNDLDATHLFIKADAEEEVNKLVDELMSKNNWTEPEKKK